MAGRKPISNALKMLKGTDQPCRMREEVTMEKITKVPPPPAYLNTDGKRVYKITAEQLAAVGLLDVVNINSVMMYANEVGKYIEAEKKLKIEGRTFEVTRKDVTTVERNPLDRMASEYLANATRLAVELGVTPAAASRVKAPEKKEDMDEFDKINNM